MATEIPSLVELFRGLDAPTQVENRNLYTAVSIPSYERYRIGKNEQGAPALLIRLDTCQSQSTPAPICLQHLYVAHRLECEIHRQSLVESGQFTVISCRDADRPMESYFLRVLQALLPTLGENPSPGVINQAVDQLVELFQALKSPPRKTAQGLWAELLVIAEASDPGVLIDAWHLKPEDLYDFSCGQFRIEVKSTYGQIRRHHFSLAQLLPPAGIVVIVASVLANRAGGGETVADLVADLASKVANTPERILRLYQVVALTLGDSWRQSTLEAFDRQAARQYLAFFATSQIPIINTPLPQGVSDVHFTADLTGRIPLLIEELKRYGGLVSVLSFSRS